MTKRNRNRPAQLRRRQQPVHPLALPLLLAFAVGTLWGLNSVFGIGAGLLDYAIAAFLLFGGVVVLSPLVTSC